MKQTADLVLVALPAFLIVGKTENRYLHKKTWERTTLKTPKKSLNRFP